MADPWLAIVERATERHGEAGTQAAEFLRAHRPQRDAEIDPDIVLDAIDTALGARAKFPWAASVDRDIFLNDVLPYAVIDERRVQVRAQLRRLVEPMVEGCKTAEEAAQAINRTLFTTLGVRYSTQRRAPNQDALETMQLKLASCSGLSILMIEACRSVGVPARLAGIASWPGRGGNHSWVEIHDGARWRYTGAAEYDAGGLDRAWFTGAAASAVPGHTLHGIWATSWKPTGAHFPLAWNPGDRSVHGVDVSPRYASGAARDDEKSSTLAIRLWSASHGTRLASAVELVRSAGDVGTGAAARTFADPDDINRVAELADPGVRPLLLRVTVDGQTRTATLTESHKPGAIIELYWDELGLLRRDALAAVERLWQQRAEQIRASTRQGLEAMALTHDGHTLRLKRRDFGNAEEGQRSLWISMHGGGGAPAAVNDQQWENQIRLYEPEEGIYIAPRAPSDTWNLWHRSEVDALFDTLIAAAIVHWGVDPNRVYLMGYSAGGDGVYQLAPRMADRFAAAAMMAGHPNDATPDGLRNLPFALFMGGDDAAYRRNEVAREWELKLGALREADQTGYPHMVRIYPGLGHWMQRKDAEALPWMAGHTRAPWPSRVVWVQGNTPHTRFYWLAVAPEHAQRGNRVVAEVRGQTISIEADPAATPRLCVLLSDALVDLDKPVQIRVNGTVAHRGPIARTESAIRASLELRADPTMAATAVVEIDVTAGSVVGTGQ
jgi:dienelactone hydrolase